MSCARAKASASFCGDSFALATTLSKRSVEAVRATVSGAAIFGVMLSGWADARRAILPALPAAAKLEAWRTQPASQRPSSACRCGVPTGSCSIQELAVARRGSASAMLPGASRLGGNRLEAAVSEVPTE
ncbi:MAG: hypothetical protein E5V45_14040 [Mesorhizobium sp.]|nr:MAG: hypothetical protein E5V45_14040 [Mesorhizobium sp.]